MVRLAIFFSDIPFSRDEALRLTRRLGTEAYEANDAHAVFDPTPYASIPDFIKRREALLQALEAKEQIDAAFFSDADMFGHWTALGEGLFDLEGYLAALCARGFDGPIVIKNVFGTDALEKSVAYLKQKIAAYFP